MAAPRVSVVVPTYNRPARLERLLASLSEQRLGPGEFEVVVVDDGSRGETASVVGAWEARGRPAVRQIRFDVSRGPAAARNAGWRAAQGQLVAFTDDDCRADPEWLSAGLESWRAAPGSFIQGRTLPDPRDADVRGLGARPVVVDTLGPQYQTCNIFYPRDLLERLAGFDERYGDRPAAEDTDLAWRAIAAGASPVFAPRALVFHAVERTTVSESLRLATRWEAAMRVFSDHPETRSMLYRGMFWNVWHYLLWRSLAALAAPRWLRRMILTLHLVQLRRRARRAGAGSWAIPYLVVHDVVECWAVSRGAVRHRTLVL